MVFLDFILPDFTFIYFQIYFQAFAFFSQLCRFTHIIAILTIHITNYWRSQKSTIERIKIFKDSDYGLHRFRSQKNSKLLLGFVYIGRSFCKR